MVQDPETAAVFDREYIVLAHGGGLLMQQLIDEIFIDAFGGPGPAVRHDSAVIDTTGQKLAFTTDSYVVDPLFFPGGDIGSLAVYGTVNDLAMCGARPVYLSAGFILEEGFPIKDLRAIAESMRVAADRAGVRIVTGDTKVVERGRGHGVFINTAGVGIFDHNLVIGPAGIVPGDAIIVNGDIGKHGIAVMAEREGFAFEGGIESDCASLADAVARLIENGIEIHCLRDLTRGGLATALVELAAADRHFVIDEESVPVDKTVSSACEILGFDPLYVACEGRFVAFVRWDQVDKTIEIMRAASPDFVPHVIGRVTDGDSGTVIMTSALGVDRVIDMLTGEQLPRIC